MVTRRSLSATAAEPRLLAAPTRSGSRARRQCRSRLSCPHPLARLGAGSDPLSATRICPHPLTPSPPRGFVLTPCPPLPSGEGGRNGSSSIMLLDLSCRSPSPHSWRGGQGVRTTSEAKSDGGIGPGRCPPRRHPAGRGPVRRCGHAHVIGSSAGACQALAIRKPARHDLPMCHHTHAESGIFYR